MSLIPSMRPGFVVAACTGVNGFDSPTEVWEPWCPREGDYVRVRPSPECLYEHDKLIDGRYGRVEVVDRTYDSIPEWIDATRDQDGTINVKEGLENARAARGHYYYVNDALEQRRTVLLDGNFAALELEPVSEDEARTAIEALRAEAAALSSDERFLWRLANLVGPDVVEAIRRRSDKQP